MSDQPLPRVRFAPSPTGYLHVGGLRTALYNYLFARKTGGTFILRIEDTDRTRYVEGAVENLIETLGWSGLDYDEGPARGGERGPYIQSERLSIYTKHVDELLGKGHAYRCFCTPERLEEMRKQQEKMRIAPKYDRQCLRLSREDVSRRLADGTPHVVRMQIPESATIAFDDIVRGRVEFQSDRVDDQVLLKSDGYPTYHLANVVDDRLMGVTHVIRGEEWLSSTPKHVLLYGYFGWESPTFAHLPLLLNADRSKLSKRQGDVAVEDYRAAGYLPAALVNFVALLGWNPGDDREIFSLEELVKEFSLERVGKSGAIFNVEKLKWINQQHIRRLGTPEIIAKVKPVLERAGLGWRDDAYLGRVVGAMRERLSSFDDFNSFAAYFFADPAQYDEAARKKHWSDQTAGHLSALIAAIGGIPEFSEAPLEEAVKSVAASAGVGAGKIIHATRLALSGIPIGPGLYELMAILGRESVLRRLRKAVDVLSARP
jgi:glutamyl-tRNA synthetase